MKNKFTKLGVLASVAILAGCNSGITYGTGVSHEEQTIEGLTNMFALTADNNSDNIDYTSRPDLVMPAAKGNLPQPGEQPTRDEDPSWPVSPEERIAAVRGEAPEVDKYGNLSTEYLTDTNKLGATNSNGRTATRRSIPRGDNGTMFINEMRDDANGEGTGRLARERKDQISFSTGVKRKYLTEPPTLYRTPSANAEAGDLGISKEEVDRKALEERNRQRSNKPDDFIPDGRD